METIGTLGERTFPAREVSHTNSLTWVKPQDPVEDEWTRIDGNLRSMELNPRSPFVPHSLTEYLAHARGMGEHAKASQIRRLKAEISRRRRGVRPVKVRLALRGKVFQDSRSAVLAQPTMWSPLNAVTSRPSVPWPCSEEMKEEGDERNTSGYRRFPALPRIPATGNAVWKQLAVLQALPFDQVWMLPTAETIAAERAVEQIDEEDKVKSGHFVGQSLMGALDCEEGSDIDSDQD